MGTDESEATWEAERAARRARQRDPHTYTTVGEWWRDYRGFVPIQMAQGLGQAMDRNRITFAEAWDLLCRRGNIILLDQPGPDGTPDGTEGRE